MAVVIREEVVKMTAKVRLEDKDFFAKIGAGNISKGIRILLEKAKSASPVETKLQALERIIEQKIMSDNVMVGILFRGVVNAVLAETEEEKREVFNRMLLVSDIANDYKTSKNLADVVLKLEVRRDALQKRIDRLDAEFDAVNEHENPEIAAMGKELYLKIVSAKSELLAVESLMLEEEIETKGVA